MSRFFPGLQGAAGRLADGRAALKHCDDGVLRREASKEVGSMETGLIQLLITLAAYGVVAFVILGLLGKAYVALLRWWSNWPHGRRPLRH